MKLRRTRRSLGGGGQRARVRGGESLRSTLNRKAVWRFLLAERHVVARRKRVARQCGPQRRGLGSDIHGDRFSEFEEKVAWLPLVAIHHELRADHDAVVAPLVDDEGIAATK